MSRWQWLADGPAILDSPLARRHPGVRALAQLVLGAPAPLAGSLTLLFDGHALQFGAPDDGVTGQLEGIHRDREWRFAPPRPPGSPATPRDLGFDLEHELLGFELDSSRRFRLPRSRDKEPGRWLDPVVLVREPGFFVRVLAQRNLGLGEAFLENEFEILRGSVHHLVAFLLVNGIDRGIRLALAERAKLLWQYARRRWDHSLNEDIADHYDIGDNIMVPMLGATGCYSCGYMERESDDLDRMQLNKMNLIFSKLRLAPGMRILDTGCGNGGMLVHAALEWGCSGEGFTNSYNMASLAQRNAEANGVADRVTIRHADFSCLEAYPDGCFDAIYEVGVWEHLPFDDYARVMRECHRILAPHGRMLIHSMGSHESRHRRDAYIQKYIFRDSNQVRLHLLLDQARRHDLYVADVENIGRHYYWTLWYWRRNLLEAYERDRTIADRDFRVMLYFLECGMAESRFGDGSVYQLLLFKDARDYRRTWRVDGRMHEPGRGAVEARPLTMRASSANAHVHNDARAEGKLVAAVYRKPAWWRRMGHWLATLRQVTHQ